MRIAGWFSLIGVAALLAGCASAHHAGTGAGPSANGATSSASGAASKARELPKPAFLSYPSEGVRLGPPPKGFTPRVSAAYVLRAFQRTDFRSFAGPLPASVTLHTVAYQGKVFPAWAVTYRKSQPVSYGPVPVSSTPSCVFVGIYDLHGNTWKTFFQDCPR